MEKREENLEKKTIESSTTTTTTTTTMLRKRPWEDLPYHILELFSKLISEPIERPNLSRVCKAWRNLKPPTSHTCFPALVHGPTTISLFIKAPQGGGAEIDEYVIRTCLGSCHGWLIISMRKTYYQPEQLYYLLNIYTKDTIQLPVVIDYLTELCQFCLLSSAPTDPDCMLLMFHANFGGFLVFSKNNNNNWIKSDGKYAHYLRPEDSIYYVFPFEGNFYALTYRGNLVAIDINLTTSPPTTNFTVAPVLNTIFPTVQNQIDGYEQIFKQIYNYDWSRVGVVGPGWMLAILIESLGKLLTVRLYRPEKYQEITKLDVLELDIETMSWIIAKNLPDGGDQVLFISSLSSFSISGSEMGIRNCIYVSDHILGKIHRYDMHNQKMIVCTDYPPAALVGDRRLWVKPTFV